MRDKTARDAGTQNLRGLKALVIGLGILVVLGTTLVIGVVVKRLISPGGPSAPQAVTTAGQVPSARPFATVLPGGAAAEIAGVAAAGGMVAVWVKDASGGKVVFIDPHTGRIAGTAAPSH